MNIDALIADTTAALGAIERNKYGREAKIERDGVVCTVSEQRGRWAGQWVQRMQLKKDGKVVSRASFKGQEYKTMNVALRAAFEAQAPQVAQDFVDYITRVFEHQTTKHPEGIPAHPRGNNQDFIMLVRNTLAPVCDLVGQGGMHWEKQTLALSQEKLQRAAQKYAEEVAVQWYYKTNQKLGAIESPELVCDSGGYVVVRGERAGKKVVMRQQQRDEVGRGCGVFHQFPALIYVDDKFTTEAAYEKMFAQI